MSLLFGSVLGACQPAGGPLARMPADSAAGEVPFTGNAAMVVPVHINGVGPLNFALDTGATLTCVDRAVASRMELPETRGLPGITAGAAAVGEIRVVILDSLRVGGAGMIELPACVVELAHARQVGVEIDGLLGLNFLRAYRVGIDFDRRILSLTNPSAVP